MSYVPVGLDIKDRNILIIGGGYLALPVVKTLAQYEANLYIISDNIIDEIKKIAKDTERIKWKEEEVTEEFIFMGYDYLFIATHNFVLNNLFEDQAKKRNIPYERMDILSDSPLRLAQIAKKGPISVGILSSRINPGITSMIYQDIEKVLEQYPEEKLQILNDIRSELLRKNTPNIDEIIKKLFHEEVIRLSTYRDQLQEDPSTKLDPEDLLINTLDKKEPKDKGVDQMIGNVGQEKGLVFKENNFQVVKQVIPSQGRIDKHNHEGFIILFTVVEGHFLLTLENQDGSEKESHDLVPGKVLKFDGDNYISAIAQEDSQAFVTLIKKEKF
ncbi:MAG: NAD(P)-dependent oxidoreductase [Tissierellia bacterium]|nr:NAD(P)-dependent oxidoreductase [Tissierellia bacterium]